jgi:hypothetical protein
MIRDDEPPEYEAYIILGSLAFMAVLYLWLVWTS